MSHIRLERPDDRAVIEYLVDRAFGPGRHTKTVYKLREGRDPVAELCFVIIGDDGALAASIRYWAVVAGGKPALLLGPLSVEPAKQGQGFGKALMHHSLATARRLGHGAAILVGDPDYYEPFGFRRALAEPLVLPGWVDERRFLGLELIDGALAGAAGLVIAPPGAKPGSVRQAPAKGPGRRATTATA